MEMIEGPSLADRIAQGPFSISEVMRLVPQLIEGLEAAHDKNIIHRDLKPANIKITPAGVAKILDFGLARATEAPTSIAVDAPTLTAPLSQAGVIMGTAPYMSPEQARAEPVDRRTDVWAFGVVVWEMLTGKRLFPGHNAAEILASVLKSLIDFSALPSAMPARRGSGRCRISAARSRGGAPTARRCTLCRRRIS